MMRAGRLVMIGALLLAALAPALAGATSIGTPPVP